MSYTIHLAAVSSGNPELFESIQSLHYGTEQGPLATRMLVPDKHICFAKQNKDPKAAAFYLTGFILETLGISGLTDDYHVVNGNQEFFDAAVGRAPSLLEETVADGGKSLIKKK